MKNHNRANIPVMTNPLLTNDAKIFIKSAYPKKTSVNFGLEGNPLPLSLVKNNEKG
tara:strand:- start:1098 stop:1265 length:168 start_codon:yes stop_codon:yes gene_type:complete